MRHIGLTFALLGCVLLIAGPAAAQSDTATVTLVHGFRGLLADVYLDGERILEGFEPARSTDPTELPAGAHDVAVREADAAPDSPPVVEATLDLPAGANLSAVVHPDADGDPTVTVFDNSIGAPGGDRARLVVRHTAAAPDVDVRANGDVVVSGLRPGAQDSGTIPPGDIRVTTSAAGSDTALLAPAEVTADPNVVVALYLIGSADDDSLGWLSQRLDTGVGTMPLGVPTGTSGLATDPQMPVWVWVAAAAALLMAARAVHRARATP